MRPTEILKREHDVILLVLEAAERELDSVKDTGEVDSDRIGKMLDFFSNFADRCHRAKEENLLFASVQERGMPRHSGPLATMLVEHDEGRARVQAAADALPRAAQGDPSAVTAVQESLFAYIELLRAHIGKEDGILYPVADQLLSAQDQRLLEERLERAEAEEMGDGVRQKYHTLAHELAGGSPTPHGGR